MGPLGCALLTRAEERLGESLTRLIFASGALLVNLGLSFCLSDDKNQENQPRASSVDGDSVIV